MPLVKRNTTDLEAGLHELAELSQHVKVEMASQQETLQGLLETMEKTISIEVSREPTVPLLSFSAAPEPCVPILHRIHMTCWKS